jgi:vacuolar-type H+-ATPase subunit H
MSGNHLLRASLATASTLGLLLGSAALSTPAYADFWSRNVAPIGHAIDKAKNDVGHTVEKAVDDTGHTLETAGQQAGRVLASPFKEAAKDAGKEVSRDAINQAKEESKKIIEDASGRANDIINHAEDRLIGVITWVSIGLGALFAIVLLTRRALYRRADSSFERPFEKHRGALH